MTTRAALPNWPRALRVEMAAAYLGMSEASFRRHVAIEPVQLAPGITAWLREDLDRWLDARAGRVAGSVEVNPWHA